MEPNHAGPRSNAGFTMMELLVVMVILAVVVALVAPNMRGMLSANRADGLVGRMAGDLMMARMEAVRAGRRVQFVLLSGGTRYAVVRSGLGAAAPDTLKRVNISQEFPGVAVTPSSATITFDSRGLVTSSAGTEIIASRDGVQRRIQISSVGTVYRDY